MFQQSRCVSSAFRRAALLAGPSQHGAAYNCCMVKGYADVKSTGLPPMSQKFERDATTPPPPTRRSKGRIAPIVAATFGVAVVGGAFIFLDPFGLQTEKKSLAPAPRPKDKNTVDTVASMVQPITGSARRLSQPASKNEVKVKVNEGVEQMVKVEENEMKLEKNNPTIQASPANVEADYESSISRIADESVQLLVSGKRTPDETKLIAERQQKAELTRLSREKEKRDAEEARLLEQQLYEDTKTSKNEDLAQTLSREMSEILEGVQSGVILNRLAGDLCKERAQVLNKAMGAYNDSSAKEYWLRVGELRKQSVHQISDAVARTSTLKQQIKGVLDVIAMARLDEMTADNPALASYEEQAKLMHQELVNSVYERDTDHTTDVMKHYYNVMQGELEDFESELQNLPEFQPGKSGERFSSEELGELVRFAHDRVYQLKKQLLELECLRGQRLEEVLEEQKKVLDADYEEGLEKKLADQKLQHTQKLDVELTALAEQDEKKMRAELARQSLAKKGHAADVLKLQAEQLSGECQSTMGEQIEFERSGLTSSLGDSLDKVERLQSHAKAKADVMEVVTNLQQLVSSARYFQLALAAKGTSMDGEYKVIDVSEAIDNCKLAVPDDTFVQTILAALPSQATTRGIYTMTSLDSRFNSVYNECKKSALFPTSTNVFSSSLSRLYGRLLLFTVKPRYDNVSDFYQHGIDEMDTKDLLVQAQYFMKRGHVAEAIKCMIQLGGVPRQLAQGWISEALLCLEVHQASDVLMHYAFSRGFSQIL